MISLTRLNHVPLVVNSDLIEHIEVTPDTVVALTTGQKLLVLETAEEIIDRIVEFRRRLLCGTVVDARGAMPATLVAAAQDSSKA